MACERDLEYSYLHDQNISPDHHEGSKSATVYDQYAEQANNTPPSMATVESCYYINIIYYLHEGTKFATPYDQYAGRANNINFIFMRDQNSTPPQNNILVGEITSTLSSWGIKISHPLWTIRWLQDINSGQTSRLQRTWFDANDYGHAHGIP